MRFPPFLRQGGTIGVTAPSCGVVEDTDKARFANAKRILATKGYHVLETPDVYGDYDGSGGVHPPRTGHRSYAPCSPIPGSM